MYALTNKINELLKELFDKMNIILVDFKIELGKTSDGKIILADEISPDTCRLWDKDTMKKLDKDRFRRDLGEVTEAYVEIYERLKKALGSNFRFKNSTYYIIKFNERYKINISRTIQQRILRQKSFQNSRRRILDAPKEECGIFGLYSDNEVDTFSLSQFGLFALQHRGQEACGISVASKGKILTVKDEGLVLDVFKTIPILKV
jgi:hypothetical protein